MAVYLVEELYELLDAIESGDPGHVCEELGDVLFQIIFIAHLYQEKGHFDIKDVVNQNIEKMIRRHPHVFGNDKVTGVDEVKQKWHAIKLKEKKNGKKESILDSVPGGLPALIRAYRISERAAKAGFDWNDISGVMEKVEEEWAELKTELDCTKQGAVKQDNVAMEFGDIIFTLVNVARFAKIHPETALNSSINKFKKRYKYMENMLAKEDPNAKPDDKDKMDLLWEEAKNRVDNKAELS